MKKLRNIIWLLVVVLSLFALAGCQAASGQDTGEAPAGDGGGDGGGEEEAPSGGEQAGLSAGINLDPANASPDDPDSATANSQVYDTLVVSEDDVSVVPSLAASWTVSDDGLDYIFYLRQDATFHDGSPVDADAVIANFNRWFDPADALRGSGDYAAFQTAFLGFKGETNSDGAPTSALDGVEKVDDSTILVHLSRQDPSLLLNLSKPAFGIVNPAVVAANVDSYGTSADSVSGSGPYMVTEWTADSLVLSPNESYWGDVPESGVEYSLQ